MNKIIFGFACASLLAFTSCADSFLKEEPKTALEGSAFFSSKANVEAAVNNLYRAGANSWYGGSVYTGNRMMFTGWMANLNDNLVYGERSDCPARRMQTFSIAWRGEDDAIISNPFNDCYVMIQRANNIIENVPKMENITTGITDAQKAQYVAEAKFYRAQNYMWIARMFGKGPLVLKPLVATDNLEIAPATEAQLWDQVIIDLNDASTGLASTSGKSQYGNSMRITQSVVDAHLADAYLYTGKYAEAAALAKKFLPTGGYSSLFALEQHVIDNTKPLSTGNPGEKSAYNTLRNINAIGATPANWFDDGSPAGEVKKSTKEAIYIQEYFSGISDINLTQNAFSTAVDAYKDRKPSNNNNAYRATNRVLDMYDDVNDLRRWQRQFFADSLVVPGSTLKNPTADNPSPYFFFDYGAYFEKNSSGRHWIVYRLPEMYLIYAEAVVKATNAVPQDAIDAVTAVRARAYITKTEAEVKTGLTGLSPDAFVKQVWLERYREFPFEYKAWFDIQRTKMYPKTVSLGGPAKGDADFVDFKTIKSLYSTSTYTETNLKLPYGNMLIQRNSKLKN